MLKRATSLPAAAVAALTLFAGCGASEFTYVKNSGERTYFKVPHEWHEVGTKSLDDALTGLNSDSAAAGLRQRLWWSVAYDASAYPSAEHLMTAGVTTEPILYARVAQTTEAQRDTISLDILRNFFLPVTQEARDSVAQTTSLTGFELLQDEVITPDNGLHGVHVVYNYDLGLGVLHTFDQTALVNNDGSKIYLLLIRCTTSCYAERSGELDTIATSFTVRSDK
ncbi:hypothetical protein KZ829_16740 [Actinoplanes hulinensis]|uniref:Lipoprotein n=1 Tax=Actinoplanes hulinensis TaxID=1144547 RepID=A0ABS7B2Y1_9ACTN|nr:hypothetical protein [Actinoplanes hulinensis]MBW6435386.1 hypothetical protein [Actinoplanes hulinensis]